MDRAGNTPIGPEDMPGGPPRADSSADQVPPEQDLLARLGELRDEFTGWVKQGARLFGAESKLFASSLLLIMILGVTAGFVIAGALLFLVGAGALSLVFHAGMDPVIAVLLATLVLFVIAIVCFFCMRNLTRHLRFTESRRMLTRLSGGSGPDEGGGTS
jgi:hypothetical protein